MGCMGSGSCRHDSCDGRNVGIPTARSGNRGGKVVGVKFVKENLYGFCRLYVDVCGDDGVFVVTGICRSITLQFANFDLFWFAGRVGCSVEGSPIGSGYGPFFFCNVEGSVGYLPGQVLSICYAYVDPCEELKVELDVFPPFVFVVTVITVCSVLVVPLHLLEVDKWDITFSSSLEPVGLELFQCSCRDGSVYVGWGPGTGLCAAFPFVFACSCHL